MEVVEGQVLAGKYRMERVLGQGGMGAVVAATHLQLGERVVLEFLLHETHDKPGAHPEGDLVTVSLPLGGAR